MLVWGRFSIFRLNSIALGRTFDWVVAESSKTRQFLAFFLWHPAMASVAAWLPVSRLRVSRINLKKIQFARAAAIGWIPISRNPMPDAPAAIQVGKFWTCTLNRRRIKCMYDLGRRVEIIPCSTDPFFVRICSFKNIDAYEEKHFQLNAYYTNHFCICHTHNWTHFHVINKAIIIHYHLCKKKTLTLKRGAFHLARWCQYWRRRRAYGLNFRERTRKTISLWSLEWS